MDIIQIIWLLIPALYYTIALWGFLEKRGRSVKKQNPGDFFKQGTFILIAVGLTFIIDLYLIEDIATILPSIMPLLLLRIILLPFVLLLVAKLTGGSKAHSIKGKGNGRKR